MAKFTLDTSGSVGPPDRLKHSLLNRAAHGVTIWTDLDPFTQGYVEALLRAGFESGALGDDPDTTHANFDEIAPETLARIMADCAAIQGLPYAAWGWLTVGPTAEHGKSAWAVRQRGDDPRFPPLTPYLGDDGRVYLREAGQ